uniref:SFRICE_001018 n=1 Tax=Spodoptera frugiperda TaxID=7108 RepID=A0A2H1UZR0_SPOFR
MKKSSSSFESQRDSSSSPPRLLTLLMMKRCDITVYSRHSCPWDTPLQCLGVFMVVSTVDPGLQEYQRYGRLWRACPNKKNILITRRNGTMTINKKVQKGYNKKGWLAPIRLFVE